ncbi:MAG TPA: riboflavin biosynthesis protein RibD [Geobacter sp.]|nr:riboflavin biosynthesis protein RibD [Geobacter sp.]HCE67359.1 riboflavin biosynthesis protein RibD [Geobacter sp.]
MRKIIFQMMITLDGYFEGPNRELDWHIVDDEFFRTAVDLLNSADTLLFGRVTYQMMAEYWPTPAAIADDPVIAERMNSLPKIVFSSTLDKSEWQNTRIVKGDAGEFVTALKQQPGMNMVIFGSSDLAVTLLKQGLLDEIRLIVNPLILGNGKSLFKGFNDILKLTLVETRTYPSGSVFLRYLPESYNAIKGDQP